MEHTDPKRRLAEVAEEILELERSVDATRTHGLLYYALLVVIIFVGFAVGYATHTVYGIILTVAGLALVAYREMGHYRERVAAIDALIVEKRHERQSLSERLGGSLDEE